MSILRRTAPITPAVMNGATVNDKLLTDPEAMGVMTLEQGRLVVCHNGVDVARLAALLDAGCSTADILAAYPSLDAGLWAKIVRLIQRYRISGAGFPKSTVKQALYQVGLDALDDVLGHACLAR